MNRKVLDKLQGTAAQHLAETLVHRIAWIRKRHEKQLADYNFENGFRAGLECALLALEGRDIMGESIDPVPRKNPPSS